MMKAREVRTYRFVVRGRALCRLLACDVCSCFLRCVVYDENTHMGGFGVLANFEDLKKKKNIFLFLITDHNVQRKRKSRRWVLKRIIW